MSSHTCTTPLRSPEQIFANSVTPVIIDSSPAVSKSAHLSPPSPLTLLRQFSDTTPGRLERPREKGRRSVYDGSSSTRGILGASPGRENIPINRDTQTAAKKRKIKTQLRSTADPGADDRCAAKSSKKSLNNVRGAKKGKKSTGFASLTLDGKVAKPGVQRFQPMKLSDEGNMTSVVEGDENPRCEVTSLQLEQATKRRDDWTPTKDTERSVIDLEREGESSPRFDQRKKGDLLFEYGFDGITDPMEEEISQATDGGPMKKRRVELLKSNYRQTKVQPVDERENDLTEDSGGNKTSKPAKKKAPPKTKLTTITSYSTAPYSASNAEDLNNVDVMELDEKRRKSRKRPSKTKSQGKTRQSDKDRQTFKVVPPLEAFKSLENQEWTFGTSSQLAREDGPNRSAASTTAMPNNSDTSMRSPGIKSQLATSSLSRATAVTKLSGSKNLWSASARDFTGEVAEIDVVDLVDTSKAVAPLTTYRIDGDKHTKSADEFLDIDNLITDLRPRTFESTSGKGDVGPRKASSEGASSAPLSVASDVEEVPESDVEQAPVLTRPSFEGFTTAELAQKVAAYGFKAIKGREKMISLLEKCWDTQNMSKKAVTAPTTSLSGTASNNKSSATSVRQAAVTELPPRNIKPKPRVGRGPSQEPANFASFSSQPQNKNKKRSSTKKSSKTADQGTKTSRDEEVIIPSSPPQNDNEPTPTISDFGPGPIIRSPEPPEVTKRAAFKFPSTDFPDFEAQITEAVRAQPRLRANNGVKQPTWHEKILLYDPIPLEDLATWLNTEGFNRIGEDREVCAAQVREWCENKGVCCVWKKPSRP